MPRDLNDHEARMTEARRLGADVAEAVRLGDLMQSEGSRIVEYVRTLTAVTQGLPYEVTLALINMETAIEDWTALRSQKGQ